MAGQGLHRVTLAHVRKAAAVARLFSKRGFNGAGRRTAEVFFKAPFPYLFAQLQKMFFKL